MDIGDCSLMKHDLLLNKDVLSGLLFAGLGVFALWACRDLLIGTTAEMRAGFIPTALSYILIFLGGVTAIGGIVARSEKIEPVKWRPLAAITFGVVAFAITLKIAGMLPAIAALVVIGSFASRELTWKELVAVVLVLFAIAVGAFHYGLGMPVPMIQGLWF